MNVELFKKKTSFDLRCVNCVDCVRGGHVFLRHAAPDACLQWW